MGIYKLSFENFKRRKLRSALTMLGIIIGVTSLILLLGFGTGYKSSVQDQTKSMMGDIVIANSSAVAVMGSVQGDAYLNKNAVSKIKNISQLYNFKEETQFTSAINGIPLMIIGTNNWNQIKDQIKINGTPGVVINKYLADKFGYKIGSKIKIKDQELTVTGIFNMSGSINMGKAGIMYLDIDKSFSRNNNKISSVKGDPEIVKK